MSDPLFRNNLRSTLFSTLQYNFKRDFNNFRLTSSFLCLVEAVVTWQLAKFRAIINWFQPLEYQIWYQELSSQNIFIGAGSLATSR
jgi:hypothetical protein